MKWKDWKRIWKRSVEDGGGRIRVNDERFIEVFGVRRKGEVTTSEQAMRIDTVYRCVDILSGTIASLPLQLLKRQDKVFLPIIDDAISDIFSGQANRRQTFFVLMQNAIISILLNGNAYIYPRRDEDFEVVELVLLSHGSVSYDIQRDKYNVNDAINQVFGVFDSWEIIHLKNKSLDGGYTGVSTITYASRTLSLSATADDQTLSELQRGNKLRGFVSGGMALSGTGGLQDKVVDAVVSRLEEDISQDRSFIRLPGTTTFQPFAITPADAQLLETRKFSPYGICRFFGVHPDMVFVEQTSNYKASENSQITFLNQTLTPLLAQIESEFYAKLIVAKPAIKRKYRIKFDLVALYRTDLRARADYIKTSIEAGVLTPNEGRISENRAPIEGGDVTFITCNVAPIDSAKIRGDKGDIGTNLTQKMPKDKKEGEE